MKNEKGQYIDPFPESKSKKQVVKEYMEQLGHSNFTFSQKQYIDWKFEQLREELLSRTDPRNFRD